MEFIITHKQFDLPIKNKEKYTVLCPKGITIENWPNIIYFESPYDNSIFSELSAMIWIYQNINAPWITINHYRRLLETLPNKICYAKPIRLPNNLAQNYDLYHNINDLSVCSNIIKTAFPYLYKTWLYTIQNNIFYPYNMVNFSLEVYRDYMDKIVTVLFTYLKSMNLQTKDDVLKFIETHERYTESNGYRNTDKNYQSRIVSFLAERLTSWYINTLFVSNSYQLFPAEVKRFDGAW